jgi:hypothetical protein
MSFNKYDQMQEDYQELFIDPVNPTRKWSINVGPGWFNVINEMCIFLMGHGKVDRVGYARAPARRMIRSIESGDLSTIPAHRRDAAPVYLEAYKKMIEEPWDGPAIIGMKEKFGTLRVQRSRTTEVQDAVIAFAEQLTGSICDVCGNPGSIVNNRGWYVTRCHQHINTRWWEDTAVSATVLK